MSGRLLTCLCLLLLLGACVDPEKAVAPVTAPINARDHIRQEMRKINGQAMRREQQLEELQQH
ncbi:MAG: hypothetical protein R3F30_15775 [Planctomycetota bacterium]